MIEETKKQISNTVPAYAQTIDECLQSLGSSQVGLSEKNAAERLTKMGANTLPEAKSDSYFVIFLRQFQSPLIYTLLCAAVLVWLVGGVADAVVIMAVLVINAFVGAIQEGKAQKSLKALKKFYQGFVTVVRGGQERNVPDSRLVFGDILIIREGEQVPADARVIESQGLLVDESVLTGESVPVSKNTDALKTTPVVVSEQNNMLFRGTLVVAGSGVAVVVATGAATELGSISHALATIDREIPLQRQIKSLSSWLIVCVLAVSLLFFLVGVFLKLDLIEVFSGATALAVSLVPEGLPVAVTLILAGGVWRMSRRKALVRKLTAVEALAHTKILAVDKTGTITRNELQVTEVWTPFVSMLVSGKGFAPEGGVELIDKKKTPPIAQKLRTLAAWIAIASDAGLVYGDGEWKVSGGDPTDAAMLVLAKKLGVDRSVFIDGGEKLQIIPFDYKRKFHAAVYRIGNSIYYVATGAPEAVAMLCELSLEDRRKILQISKKFAAKGLRAIAVAGLVVPHGSSAVMSVDTSLPRLTFAGIVGMVDFLQPNIVSTVQTLSDAGIRTIMLTGDIPETAKAIAKASGIFKAGDLVLSGIELSSLKPHELTSILPRVSVFARVTPEDKLNIIQAFGSIGMSVAMTGDGVNDAPALLAADLGISMGKKGTAVAREASDMVLLDDNFATIISAVEEGRGIYRTIQKVLVYLFSTSVAELFAIGGALLMGFGLLLSGAQIVWLNFVTDGFLTVGLGFEPTSKIGRNLGVVKNRVNLLGRKDFVRILWLGLVMAGLSLFMYQKALPVGEEYARSLTLTFLSVVQWFNAWNVRTQKSILTINPFRNRWLVVATFMVIGLQALAVYWAPLQKLLHTQSLSVQDWLMIAGWGLLVFLADEVWKLAVRLFSGNK